MEKRDLKVGDLVQINPEHDPMFGACIMIVTEPKSWGAQGACLGPGCNGLPESKGIAFYRCKFENMEFVGHAEWVPGHAEEEEDDDDDAGG